MTLNFVEFDTPYVFIVWDYYTYQIKKIKDIDFFYNTYKKQLSFL